MYVLIIDLKEGYPEYLRSDYVATLKRYVQRNITIPQPNEGWISEGNDTYTARKVNGNGDTLASYKIAPLVNLDDV